MTDITVREGLAAALCNVQNGHAAWETIPEHGRSLWLTRADRVIRELASRGWVCAHGSTMTSATHLLP
jgi:hypothetical protein